MVNIPDIYMTEYSLERDEQFTANGKMMNVFFDRDSHQLSFRACNKATKPNKSMYFFDEGLDPNKELNDMDLY